MSEPKFCNQCGGALQSTKRHPRICIKCKLCYQNNNFAPLVSLVAPLEKEIEDLENRIDVIQNTCVHEFLKTNETSQTSNDDGYGRWYYNTTYKYLCPYCEKFEWRRS